MLSFESHKGRSSDPPEQCHSRKRLPDVASSQGDQRTHSRKRLPDYRNESSTTPIASYSDSVFNSLLRDTEGQGGRDLTNDRSERGQSKD